MKNIVSLNLAVALFCLSAYANPVSQTFPMEFTDKGHAYIKANLDDLENLPMVVDTAAQIGIFPKNMLTQLKSKQLSNETVSGATGGPQQMQSVVINKTSVGRFEQNELTYIVQNLEKLRSKDGKTPGILGYDFLHHYCVDLNFNEAKVNLNHGACDEASVVGLHHVPFKIENNFIKFQMKVQEVTVDVKLDTGAPHTVINTPLYKQLSGLSVSGTIKAGGLAGGAQEIKELSGLSYHLNGQTIKEETVHLADFSVFEILGYKDKPFVLLGIDAFKKGRLVVDYTKNRLYFKQ